MVYLLVLLVIFSFLISTLMEVNKGKLSSDELDSYKKATFQDHWWSYALFIIWLNFLILLLLKEQYNYTYFILYFLPLLIWGLFIQLRIRKANLPRNFILRDAVLRIFLLTLAFGFITTFFNL